MKKRFYLDYKIFLPYIILSVVGVVMVYSAGSYRLLNSGLSPSKEAVKQGAYLFVSIVALFIIYKMKNQVFQEKQLIMVSICIMAILLLLTKFTPLGVEVNGARGWLDIAGIRIQPVEFLKLILVWYLAYILSRRQPLIVDHFWESIKGPIMVIFPLIFLVLIQPDNGGAMILVAIVLVMLFASGIDYQFILKFTGVFLLLSLSLIELINWTKGSIFPDRFQYVYHRFAVFRNPFLDYDSSGYQLANSYFAIYHGGWFGVGLGNSIQKRGFLPEAQTDFIFSIVIEELGVVTAIILLALLFFLILRIFYIGIKASTTFNSLMCIGIAGMLLIQVFVNLGGITGIIPLTGVTFPFLSQGGSSLIVNSLAVGFVLNINAEETRKNELKQYS